MSAAQRAYAMAIFMICIGFGMTIIEEVNSNYEDETGRIGGLKPYSIDAVQNATDLDDIGTTQGQMNDTIHSLSDFQKPSDIGFDFGFFQGINTVRIMTNLLINSTWGFPKLLALFGMPSYLVNPLAILIGFGYISLIIYILLGKGF